MKTFQPKAKQIVGNKLQQYDRDINDFIDNYRGKLVTEKKYAYKIKRFLLDVSYF